MRNFKVKVFDRLPPKLSKVVEQFKKEAYQVEKPPYTKKQRIEHDEKFCSLKDRFKYLLALQNDEIIGGLTLLKRWVTLQNKKILLGGIGGVWVRLDKQKMGVATTLLKRAILILNKNNCHIAYLRTDIKKLAKLFQKVGFQILSKRYAFLGKSGKRYYGRDGMIAPITSKAIFTKVLQDKKPFDIGFGNW